MFRSTYIIALLSDPSHCLSLQCTPCWAILQNTTTKALALIVVFWTIFLLFVHFYAMTSSLVLPNFDFACKIHTLAKKLPLVGFLPQYEFCMQNQNYVRREVCNYSTYIIYVLYQQIFNIFQGKKLKKKKQYATTFSDIYTVSDEIKTHNWAVLGCIVNWISEYQ